MKKQYKGKAIYNPSGKAGEYSYWACNFYTGCSNGCEYCYLKKGILSKSMGGDKPKLKACFEDEDHALGIFEKELVMNKEELQKHGLFFSFTTDPMLFETIFLTINALAKCLDNDIPVKILTKTCYWIESFLKKYSSAHPDDCTRARNLIAFGFTLTGHDELEPGATSNAARILAMKILHDKGFKTFASVEPIIDFPSSLEMIKKSANYSDLFKIGLQSGRKYDPKKVKDFIYEVCYYLARYRTSIYWKDSLLNQCGMTRLDLFPNCVDRNYNLFKGVYEYTI